MKLWKRIIDQIIRQSVELDLVVVEKERNTGAVEAIYRHVGLQDIHDTQTKVKTRCDTTDYFDIEVLFTSRVWFEPAIYTKLTKIEEFVCPPNISETVAVRTVKLAHRPHIASTTIKFI